ncbi:hypothetical protein ACTWKB_02585 [Bacillus sp. 4A_MP2]
MNIEHPMITQINATGYPKGVEVVDVVGTDYFGDEISQMMSMSLIEMRVK